MAALDNKRRTAAASFAGDRVQLWPGDSLDHYERWPRPDVIVSDGPYGLRSFPGEGDVGGLAELYEPHATAWAKHAKPSTTLWFWCSEIGWATVHPILDRAGWQYVRACVWDKGAGHIAGNANSKTLRQLPAATELCVQYVRRVSLPLGGGSGEILPMKDWLRAEWQRSGLPLSLTNEVAGVANAATRKWFTACHLWYAPPGEALAKLAEYANLHGDPAGRPYFSLKGRRNVTAKAWDALRPTFNCPPDRHNVWHHPAVRGHERVKLNGSTAHMNQKPLGLIRDTISWTSNPGGVVWEPFAGTGTALAAAILTKRNGYGAEIHEPFFHVAADRLRSAEADA